MRKINEKKCEGQNMHTQAINITTMVTCKLFLVAVTCLFANSIYTLLIPAQWPSG